MPAKRRRQGRRKSRSSFLRAVRHKWSRRVHATTADRGTGIDLEAFHAGQETVIRAIYVQHGAALLRETGRYAGAAEAESVVHDVFVELLRNRALRAQFVGGSHPLAR